MGQSTSLFQLILRKRPSWRRDNRDVMSRRQRRGRRRQRHCYTNDKKIKRYVST